MIRVTLEVLRNRGHRLEQCTLYRYQRYVRYHLYWGLEVVVYILPLEIEWRERPSSLSITQTYRVIIHTLTGFFVS